MAATNGPYHWGNGPKPTRRPRKKSKGCAITALLIITSPLAAGYSLWELFA